MPDRRRLPNRRNAVTEALVIGNISIVATIGFDAAGRAAEIFLSGAKGGSGMAAILDDAWEGDGRLTAAFETSSMWPGEGLTRLLSPYHVERVGRQGSSTPGLRSKWPFMYPRRVGAWK